MATIEKPSPQLILEYFPLGNLEDQHRQRPISDDEVLTILHQSLSALTYLHGQTPPIVHRDIKPGNILVQSRDPLHVKLADFGLSKASDYLTTLCGTHIYLAPEIARYCGSNTLKDVKYTNAVDIWSFGVVIFQYACGLPHPGAGIGLPWCQKIINALDDWDSDDLIGLLSTMIVMDPKLRDPAWKCLRRALLLPIPGRSLTPTPASYSLPQTQIGEENQAMVVDCRLEDCTDSQQEDSVGSIRDTEIQRYIRRHTENEYQATVDDVEDCTNTQQEDSFVSIRGSEIQGHIRSKVSIHSGAQSLVEKRKRSTPRSAASSVSSGRRTKKSLAWTESYLEARLLQELRDG